MLLTCFVGNRHYAITQVSTAVWSASSLLWDVARRRLVDRYQLLTYAMKHPTRAEALAVKLAI
jgi:hypothetical protein